MPMRFECMSFVWRMVKVCRCVMCSPSWQVPIWPWQVYSTGVSGA